MLRLLVEGLRLLRVTLVMGAVLLVTLIGFTVASFLTAITWITFADNLVVFGPITSSL